MLFRSGEINTTRRSELRVWLMLIVTDSSPKLKSMVPGESPDTVMLKREVSDKVMILPPVPEKVCAWAKRASAIKNKQMYSRSFMLDGQKSYSNREECPID